MIQQHTRCRRSHCVGSRKYRERTEWKLRHHHWERRYPDSQASIAHCHQPRRIPQSTKYSRMPPQRSQRCHRSIPCRLKRPLNWKTCLERTPCRMRNPRRNCGSRPDKPSKFLYSAIHTCQQHKRHNSNCRNCPKVRMFPVSKKTDV